MIVFRFLRRLASHVWNGTPMTSAGRDALAESQRARGAVAGHVETQLEVRQFSRAGMF